MYKDKEKQKEANRLANKVYRDRQKGITQEGITEQGITWYPNKPTDGLGQAITPVILSDGQKWHPRQVISIEGNDTELPDNVYFAIVQTAGKYGRFEERIENAVRYQEGCPLSN